MADELFLISAVISKHCGEMVDQKCLQNSVVKPSKPGALLFGSVNSAVHLLMLCYVMEKLTVLFIITNFINIVQIFVKFLKCYVYTLWGMNSFALILNYRCKYFFPCYVLADWL